MTSYTFAVTVDAETAAQAAQVMGERIDHDEDYGFPYTVERAMLPIAVDGEPYEDGTGWPEGRRAYVVTWPSADGDGARASAFTSWHLANEAGARLRRSGVEGVGVHDLLVC